MNKGKIQISIRVKMLDIFSFFSIFKTSQTVPQIWAKKSGALSTVYESQNYFIKQVLSFC